jgi:hypothetical protein
VFVLYVRFSRILVFPRIYVIYTWNFVYSMYWFNMQHQFTFNFRVFSICMFVCLNQKFDKGTLWSPRILTRHSMINNLQPDEKSSTADEILLKGNAKFIDYGCNFKSFGADNVFFQCCIHQFLKKDNFFCGKNCLMKWINLIQFDMYAYVRMV